MRVRSIIKLGFVGAAVLLVALVAVVKSIDVNAYRGVLAAAVKDATGRDLVIKGSLALKVSANPALIAEDVSLSNAPFGSRPEMAHVGRIEAAVGLLPLLSRELRIERLVLIEPDLLLEEDGRGGANYLFPGLGSGPSEAEAESILHTKLAISQVRIEKGRVEWRRGSDKTPQVWTVQRLTLDTPSPSSAALAATGTWNGRAFDLSGVLGGTAALAAAPGPNGQPFPIKLKAVLPSLVLALDGKVTNGARGRGLDVKVSADTAELAEAGRLFGYVLPSLGAARLSFTAEGPLTAPVASGIDLAAGRQGQLNMVAKGKIPLTGKGIDLTLGFEAESLAGAGHALGWDLPAIGPVKLSARLRDLADGYRLSDIKGSLGKSDVAGQATLALRGPGPSGKMELTSATVDLGEWIGPSRKSPGRPSSERVFPDTPLPWDAIRSADLDLDFDWHVDHVVDTALVAENVRLLASLRKGRLELTPAVGAVAGGKASAKLTVDTTVTPAALALQAQAEKVALGGVLAGLGVTDTIAGGPTNLKLALTGRGETLHAVMASLDGESFLSSGRARVERVQADFLAVDLLRQLLPSAGDKDTDLHCLVSKFSLKDGLAKSEALLFDTAQMTVSGQGSINLANEGIDLTFSPKPKEPSLLSLAMPLDVGGTLGAPSVTPDRAAIAKGVATVVGGIALGGPFGLLLPFISAGDDNNACLAALEQAKRPPAHAPKPARSGHGAATRSGR